MSTGSNRTRLVRALAAAAVAALLASACAADDEDVTATAEQPAEAETVDGVLQTVGGGQIDINSLEGTDTILWFWAPW